MMADFHFLRPLWLLLLIPLIGFAIALWRKRSKLHAWEEVCDSHLLNYLLKKQGQSNRPYSLLLLIASTFLMIVSIAGPSWVQLPVVTYKSIQPKVLILDMSDSMMATDLSPNRLARAKFKLHDLLTHKDAGQFGLVVFTSEPFVVSPLTDDGQTISSLLSSLNQEVMPVSGQNLADALNEASTLIHQAGFKHGQLLVLTADSPSIAAITLVKKLTEKGITSSIMPIRADNNLNPLFQKFAEAGQGTLLRYTADESDIEYWLKNDNQDDYAMNKDDEIPLWKDEGRWFLIPALLLLLPLFQRGRLQRMTL